jgi:hypothetical protein
MLNPDAPLNPKMFDDDTEERPTRNSRVGFAPIIIILAVVIVAAVAGYVIGKQSSKSLSVVSNDSFFSVPRDDVPPFRELYSWQ